MLVPSIVNSPDPSGRATDENSEARGRRMGRVRLGNQTGSDSC
jgi:hypothetical protein